MIYLTVNIIHFIKNYNIFKFIYILYAILVCIITYNVPKNNKLCRHKNYIRR